jgi:MGT family glycosyltransferase
MIAVFTLPAMGHIKPMMPIVKELVQRKHSIVCYGHTSFADLIESTGAAFKPYPKVDYDVDEPNFNLVAMGAHLITAADQIFRHLLPEVKALAPRLIIQDSMAPWAGRLGTHLNIPRIHTIPTLVFNRATVREMRREDGILKLAQDIALGAPRLLIAGIRTRFAISIAEAFGLEGSWRRIAKPRCEIVFSIKAFQNDETQGDVPRSYVGQPCDEVQTFKPVDHKGYALITFGTLSNHDARRFASALRGVFHAGLSAVVVCNSRKIDMRALDHVSQSLEMTHPGQTARILDRVPALEPWISGADLVIHHAGTATAWETARLNRPALLIPINADQKVFANNLERYGIGTRLADSDVFNPPAIAKGISTVLNKNYPWTQFRQCFEEAGGTRAAVDLILKELATIP